MIVKADVFKFVSCCEDGRMSFLISKSVRTHSSRRQEMKMERRCERKMEDKKKSHKEEEKEEV